MGKDDEKGCKLFVFHRRVINDEGKRIIGKNISQGCLPLQRGYSGVLRVLTPKVNKLGFNIVSKSSIWNCNVEKT